MYLFGSCQAARRLSATPGDVGRCRTSERRRKEEKSQAERCCSHSAGSVTCTVCRLTALRLFFLLKTVYSVNFKEPESQNSCSRNHFEGDNFKSFITEPTAPKPPPLNQCWAPGAHLPYGNKPQAVLGAGSASGRSEGTLAGGGLLQTPPDQE